MRDHPMFRIGLVVAAGTLLAGCAGSTDSPTSAPPSSAPVPAAPSSAPAAPAPASSAPAPGTTEPSAALPTLTKPAKPPREPTDNLPSTGWVAGSVTRGGTGPCYGLIADDGTRYALYATDGTELTDGTRVKVKLETTLLRIYCGPGKLMAMVDSETIQ